MTQNNQTTAWGLDALRLNREARRNQLEANAPHREHFMRRNGYYYDGVKRLLRYIVEPGKRVLEIRCATGHLLDAVKPSYGLGTRSATKWSRSPEPNIRIFISFGATRRHRNFDEKFDYVVFSHI